MILSGKIRQFKIISDVKIKTHESKLRDSCVLFFKLNEKNDIDF